MSRQHTRRRRARCAVARAIAVGGAMATLAAALGTGQALASAAQPDERVLERQGRIDHQADEQGRADAPAQQGPGPATRRFTKPEPKLDPGPWIDDEPSVPAQAPPRNRPNLAVPVTVAILLVLGLGVATVWLRSRRPRPEPTSRPEPTT
jgi:hypothetical protein